MPLRLGLLSTARINGAILQAAAKGDRVDVVAVASRDEDRAKAYAVQHGIAKAFGDYEALLADSGIDAVYVSLPNSLHPAWSMRALHAGKHVLCEKPFSPDPALVADCFDAADQRKLVLMEAFMWRHHPQADKLKEMVDAGAIGRLQTIRAAFSFILPDQPDIRLDRELEGGALMDVGCYCVSGCRMLAGEPIRVHGEAVRAPSGLDLRFAATLRFPHDVLATIDCGFDVAARDELEAIGSDGALFLDDPWFGKDSVIEYHRDGGVVQRITVPPADPYVEQLANFADAIEHGAAPRLGREDAMGQARAISALYEAAA